MHLTNTKNNLKYYMLIILIVWHLDMMFLLWFFEIDYIQDEVFVFGSFCFVLIRIPTDRLTGQQSHPEQGFFCLSQMSLAAVSAKKIPDRIQQNNKTSRQTPTARQENWTGRSKSYKKAKLPFKSRTFRLFWDFFGCFRMWRILNLLNP